MSATELTAMTLADRYEKRSGRVHLTGIQALARLPIDQSRIDSARGRRIGTYISGYEGSPLAGYDLELARQAKLLHAHHITFRPGLNEEIAATAVEGTQLIDRFDADVEGVTGFWYGKAPGLDRSADAFRHANLMGTSPAGGAVALVGDDPGAKSSSIPCASERMLSELAIPTFYPVDAAEILTLGKHAVALSRASGLWTALKIVTSVADGSTEIDLLDDSFDPVLPAGAGTHQPDARLLQPVLGPMERDFATIRMAAVDAYVGLNRLNRVEGAHAGDRIGIVTAGKTYLDVKEALAQLGVDEDTLRALGVRLLKLALVWPLHRDEVLSFAEGLDRIIVIEEKRSFIETELRALLYGTAPSPQILGKFDAAGDELFPAYGELDADLIAGALARQLREEPAAAPVRDWVERRQEASTRRRLQLPLLPTAARTPYFCSGCPHNTSTKPPSGSKVGAGIGCHTLVLLMEEKQVGDVVGLTQMGGEGALWLGASHFVKDRHFTQNLGDGTFHHSGSLAIRAAVAAGADITYRLLYNSTVAMTGGQAAVGQLDVAHLISELLAEGVARIIVTTDDTRALRRQRLPRSVRVWDRSRIGEAEQILAATPGTTVLIHVQECATELRRKRKRGDAPAVTTSVMINERLCEGCGDCGAKSNCMSVHPVETDFGRKSRIQQSSCNADLTCLNGDCPAFMTVEHGSGLEPRSALPALDAADLPAAPQSGVTAQSVRLLGIGGTGIVTTSQVLATAALLAGYHVRTLDQTGVAQKGGAVVSDVKFSSAPIDASNKVGHGQSDLYLGYDLLVAAAAKNLDVLGPDTAVVLSTSSVPTGAMVSNKDVAFPAVGQVVEDIRGRVGPGRVDAVDSLRYAEVLFGAEQFANAFLLGVALQRGALALRWDAIEEALRLNGVAVETNLQAFRRGRQYVADRPALEAAIRSLITADPRDVPAPTRGHAPSDIVRAAPGSKLELLVARRRAELIAYQNAGYARRYEELVEDVRAAEQAQRVGDQRLSEAVARYAFKLMAYKDEYEVARLARDPEVHAELRSQFGRDTTYQWRLHPPILRALGMRNKIALGPWFGIVFAVLYRLRWLRHTPADPFGMARVRRIERRLVGDYLQTIERVLPLIGTTHHADLVRLAALPDMVRGYEQVKLDNVERYDNERGRILQTLPL